MCAGCVLALAPGVQHDLDAIGPRLAANADDDAGELLRALDYGDRGELSARVAVARAQSRTERCNALARLRAWRTQAEALALLDPPIARLDRSGADPSAGETLCDYAALLEFEGRLDEAAAMLGDAERLARASSDLTLLGAVLQVRAVCNHPLGRLQAAAADYDAARRLHPRSRGEEAEGSFEEAGLARHWRDLGRFAESIELAETAIAAARARGRDRVVAHTQLILALRVQLGRAARQALRHALHWIETTVLPNVPAEFRDSFLNRNPINRAVVAASRRLS